MERSTKTTFDVIIVGGGISGLYTAVRYLDNFPDAKVALLESSSRLGGRVHTFYSERGKYQYETGGSRFNNYHKITKSLVDRYGLHTIPISSQKTLCAFNPALAHRTSWTPSNFRKAPTHVLRTMTFREYLSKFYSPEESQYFQTSFGYDGEFNEMNAHDALRIFERDFSHDAEYFIIREGFSALIQKMKEDIQRRGGKIFMNTKATSFKRLSAPNHHSFVLTLTRSSTLSPSHRSSVQEKQMLATTLVFALPKDALKHITAFKHAHWIDSVQEIPLHRIYGKFTDESEYMDTRFTTDAPIRQYIPVLEDKKISMVSYSDTEYARYWHKAYLHDKQQCKKMLEGHLRKLNEWCSPSRTSPIRLQWIRSYYWEHGVHLWKPRIDSKASSREVLTPLGKQVSCYIVGEAYSRNQGWVEGALETVEDVFEKYLSKR